MVAANTRLSLLQNARSGNELAWEQLASLYRPMIHRWLVRQSISRVDAEEISQEVLIVVSRKLPEFKHRGNAGAFRCWLRTITSNQIRTFARKRYRHPPGVGGSEFLVRVENLKDNDSPLSREWDQEHNIFVVDGILKLIGEQVGDQSIEIFRRLVLDQLSAQQVADHFGVSVGSVYSAKSRVMRKIRQLGRDLLDESCF